jgi:hypothetical protein
MPRLTVIISMLAAACSTARTAEPPRFAQVGVIEGFYGPPWSHEDRLDILRFMGRVGLTHYYYAPKDDPFHRTRWRDPYPDSAYRALGDLAATAAAHGVTFVYAISPGGSMVYADSADYDRLVRKLESILALGVRDVALMLDDVPPTLQHERDRDRFASLARAHAALITRLHTDLSARGVSLAVTPTTYTDAWGDRAYLRELGALVPTTIPFFWTGTDVVAPAITAADAAVWSEQTGRLPLVWDNYPVNDFARWRLFLGPLRNRAADLPRAVRGIIANPMNEAHASMIPLATLATYAQDPERYDPDAAMADALQMLYGSAAPLLDPFLDVFGDYALDRNRLEPLFIPANRFAVGPIVATLERLRAALHSLDSAAASRPDLHAFIEDVRPFVERASARLAELERDPTWERRDDELVYRPARDRIGAPLLRTPILVDGDVGDWPAHAWRSFGNAGVTRYATGVRRDTLFLGVNVTTRVGRVEAGNHIANGDHIAIVVQGDTDATRQALTADDVVLLLSPNDAMVRRMPFHGFMAKYLADNARLTWSEFLLSTFAEPVPRAGEIAAVGRGPTGWSAEIAIPLEGRQSVRVSLTVTTTARGERRTESLAARNFPANPATFAEIHVTP